MNETIIENPSLHSDELDGGRRNRRSLSSGFYGYLLLVILVAAGWSLRDRHFFNPEEGIGYWLGITGGSLMLMLLVYPLRKKYRLLQSLGSTKAWFQTHIVLGLVGPLLVLYHCNFKLGSFNSQVAFYAMLLVAGSGIVGRYFYAAIHRGLNGRKTSLDELQKELATSTEESNGMARLMPNLVQRLHEQAQQLQGHQITQTLGIGRSLRWTFTHNFERLSLVLLARRELRAAARSSDIVSRDYRRLRRSANRYIRDFTRLLGRVAQFSFYERLFAIWHVFHLPLFYVLVLSASFHVLAVHMY
jgi:hypothetical protein